MLCRSTEHIKLFASFHLAYARCWANDSRHLEITKWWHFVLLRFFFCCAVYQRSGNVLKLVEKSILRITWANTKPEIRSILRPFAAECISISFAQSQWITKIEWMTNGAHQLHFQMNGKPFDCNFSLDSPGTSTIYRNIYIHMIATADVVVVVAAAATQLSATFTLLHDAHWGNRLKNILMIVQFIFDIEYVKCTRSFCLENFTTHPNWLPDTLAYVCVCVCEWTWPTKAQFLKVATQAILLPTACCLLRTYSIAFHR